MPGIFPAPISPNYAEIWQKDLLDIKLQGAISTTHIVPNVTWLDGQTFRFPQMSVSGFFPHARTGGFGKGFISSKNIPYTVTHDRDVQFFVDIADQLETLGQLAVKNVAEIFQRTQVVPEIDARFFEVVADAAVNGVWHSGSQKALPASDLYSSTKVSAYTNSVISKIKSYIRKVKEYQESLIIYVSSLIMDKLELTTELARKVEMTALAPGGLAIETRYTHIDGVPIVEVRHDKRFYSKYNYEPKDAQGAQKGGFEPAEAIYTKVGSDDTFDESAVYYKLSDGAYAEETVTSSTFEAKVTSGIYLKTQEAAKQLNVVVASLNTVVTVPKIATIYFLPRGSHSQGDGDLFQTREFWDTFVFPNGLDGKIDSVYVDFVTPES